MTAARNWLILVVIAFALSTGPRAEEKTPPGEVEPNDSSRTATDVPSSGDVAATVRATGDRDCFRIRIDKPTHLSIGVTGVEGVDFSLRLYDSDRQLLLNLNGCPAGEGEEAVRRVRRDTVVLEISAAVKPPLAGDAPYVLKLRHARLLEYEPPMEEIKAAIARGLDYLKSHQEEDGSWEVAKGDHGVAGLALMGFVAEKREADRETIEKAAALFRGSYQDADSFGENAHMRLQRGGSLAPWTGHFLYENAIAVLAMSEYLHHGHGEEGDRAMVGEAVDLLLRSQAAATRPKELNGPVDEKNDHFGGWRYYPNARTSDLSASGWCLIALAAAETAGFAVPEQVREDFMVYCRRCFDEKQNAYRYETRPGRPTNTTNAVGVLTTLMCVGGECPVVRRGLRTIRNNLPAWEVEGLNGRYPFYYWYYASRAMYVAGGDYWKQWRGVMCPLLLKQQDEDGHWDAALDEEKVGVPYTTALAVLILQLMSGNPPAYLKGLELRVENYPCPRCVDDIEDLIRAARRDNRKKEDVLRQIQEIIDRYRGE